MAFEPQFVGATLAQSLLGHAEHTGLATEPKHEHSLRTVIAFVGMAFEAKIAEGPGVLALTREKRRELAAAAESAARHGYRGIISFGVAGGLTSGLLPGDWVIASEIREAETSFATDRIWSHKILDAIGQASYAPIIGVDYPVAEPETKRTLHRTTGAAVVDMESHVVARLAAAHGIPFTALRVVVDPVDRAIPSAALVGMGPGGRADPIAVLRDLAAKPRQLSGLLRVSLDAFIARSEMLRVRDLLGPHFGLGDVIRSEPADLPEPALVQPDAAPYRSPA
jgi:adenosylhomocysteine nucleosidase